MAKSVKAWIPDKTSAMYIAFVAVFVVMYFCSDHELNNVFCMLVVFVVGISLVVRMVLGRAPSMAPGIVAFISCFLVFSLISRAVVINAADNYVQDYLVKGGCQSVANAHLDIQDGWQRVDAYKKTKQFKFYGYSRTIRLQDNGFLRYGFLYDGARSIWLKKC